MSCPPEDLPESTSLCEAEAMAMACCGLLPPSDPPAAEECNGALGYYSIDPEWEHCVPLIEALLACTSRLGCERLLPYAEVAKSDPTPADFAGIACEAQAVAVLEAGCQLVTTG